MDVRFKYILVVFLALFIVYLFLVTSVPVTVRTPFVFGGIGVRLDKQQDYPWVSDVLPNTPADRAGIRNGDFIVSVDGSDTSGLDLEEVSGLLRGPVGSGVVLLVEGPTGVRTSHVVVRDVIEP